MAPFSLVTASVSILAKSFTALSCTSSLTRCSSVLSAYIHPVRCLSSEASGPPKRPLNGYMRFILQQRPVMNRQYPEIKPVDIVKKVAEQWRGMSPEQKRPFEEASVRAREQFRVDLQRYQDQLTPAQIQQQTQEKRQRMAKRKAIRKKRELNTLGKPKRPRSPFNIFMSEHFEEARGTTTQSKMMTLLEDWRSLLSHQKKIYTQLAEDDKVRYKNEIKSWEDHMIEIGREDLIRESTMSSRKKLAKKPTKKPTKSTAAKKTAAKRKKTTRKTTKSSSTAKTVRTTKKT